MEQQKIFLAGMIALTGLVLIGVISTQNIGEADSDISETSDKNVSYTEDGLKYTVHPDKLQRGCPSKDCIPSIDDPSFISAEEADWMNPGDRIIGLEINGDSRAYPLRILNVHEIVNDRVGGEPIVVTYCPLCRSGVTYSREVGGEELDFGVSGLLLNANLVMYDRETETYWSQIEGEAIIGPRTPQKLDLKFSSIMNWSKWKKGHPETKVLSRDTGIYSESRYDSNPYAGFEKSERVGFGVEDVDERLPSKEIVFGIVAGEQAKAYTEETIREKRLIQDEVGGEPVAILESSKDGSIVAFIRGDNGDTIELSLEKDGLRDSQGRLWNFDGQQVDGAGEMERLNPRGFFWFAWSKFHPDTKVYKQGQ